jgi:hypothetical protein
MDWRGTTLTDQCGNNKILTKDFYKIIIIMVTSFSLFPLYIFCAVMFSHGGALCYFKKYILFGVLPAFCQMQKKKK